MAGTVTVQACNMADGSNTSEREQYLGQVCVGQLFLPRAETYSLL